MRIAAMTIFCLVAFGYMAKSQRFTLLPQVGFENSKTTISYNDLPSFSPAGVQFSPQASLRLVYTSKHGDGFFLGVTSSQPVVNFSFTDPQNGMNNFIAATGNMQLRLEGGYQFNSKPISLSSKKQTSSGHTSKSNSNSSSAGSYYCHRGFGRCHGSNKSKQFTSTATKGAWVRLQPSIGMRFMPGIKSDVITTTQNGQTSYEYRAGNYNTALIAGAGLEFGRKSTRLFTISINYFKALGNLGTQTISSTSGVKSVMTNLQSAVSGWSMKIGVPFTLGSKNSTASHKKRTCQHRSFGQYRMNHSYFHD